MKYKFSILFLLISGFVYSQNIEITSPMGGWTSSRLVTVAGETTANVDFVTVIFNKIPLRLPVHRGRFSRELIAGPGENSIIAKASTKDGDFIDSVNFYSKAPPKPLKIILMWDTDGTDVDLHVVEPNGEECYYGYRETTTGGSLDVDITNGYGPEIYTRSVPLLGEYNIRVKYYSDNGYPQTMVTVYIVVDEGTESERIIKRETMLTKTGTTIEMDAVTIN